MSQTIDFANTQNINFNSNKVEILRLNGVEIWIAEKPQEPSDVFNYTAFDSNGYMEGHPLYNGTPAEYGIGKPSNAVYECYKTLIPTTQEEYVGNYYYNASAIVGGPMTLITADNIANLVSNGTIVVGTTPCYKHLESGEGADYVIETIEYAKCNGYNSDYYGYDFTTAIVKTTSSADEPISESERIISENLVIPDKYNGLPVTKILDYAFYGYMTYAGTSDTKCECYQGCFIKTILLGKNIKYLGASCFEYVGRYYVPLGEDSTSSRMVVVLESVTLNDKLETIKNNCFYGAGSKVDRSKNSYGVNSGTSTIHYELPNALMSLESYVFSGATSVRFNSNVVESVADYYTYVSYTVFSNLATSVNLYTIPEDTKFVFEQDADTEVTITVTKPKSARKITIYTDNTSVKNFDWSTNNYTVTFKSLSEYTGS